MVYLWASDKKEAYNNGYEKSLENKADCVIDCLLNDDWLFFAHDYIYDLLNFVQMFDVVQTCWSQNVVMNAVEQLLSSIYDQW